MKSCARYAIAVLVLATGVAARAQTCTTPVTAFQGQYTISGSGTGTDIGGMQWTVNETATATVNAPLRQLSCTQVAWAGPGVALSGTFNDVGVEACPPPGGGQMTITITGSLSQSISSVFLSSTGTYTFVPGAIASGTYTLVNCDGSTFTSPISKGIEPANWVGPPNSFPPFPLPSTPQPLTGNLSNFQGIWDAGQFPITWNFSFTLDPIDDDCPDCKQQGGGQATDMPDEELLEGDPIEAIPVSSTISSQNRSLGEDVPIMGTGFYLHFESSRAPGANGSNVNGANSVPGTDAAMIGGWTLNAHHAYDPVSNTLYLGDGGQRNPYELGTPVVFNGNFLLTSEEGSKVYVFSSSGQHLQTVRPLTGALEYQFGYDAAGKLVTVTDANGNVTTIQRDASEHPTAIVSPYGQTTDLSVDANGFLSQVTDPLGKSQTFTNGSTGLLASRTDRNGNIFNYTYDSNGKLVKDADSLGGFISLAPTVSPSGLGWTVGEATSMGRNSSYQSTVNAPWVQTSTSTFSNQHANTWPNGLQATTSITQQGSQISESLTFPDGVSNSGTLGPDPIWGIQVPVTTSQILTKGNLTMNIAGNSAASLGTAGNPFSLTSRMDTTSVNFRTYTSNFTASNMTFVNTTPLGRQTTTVLDNQERIASLQVAGLLPTDFTYDSRGRFSTIMQGARNSSFTYDANGRLATATDPLGLQKSLTYDADGRVLTNTLPDSRVTGYQYDANGNLTAVIPPGKFAHTFTYTAVNEVSQYLPPSVAGTGPTTYTYDLDRHITQITRPDLQTIGFGYDNAGRLSSITTPTETINYAYDATSGNFTSASVTGGEALTYGYNGSLSTSATWAGTISGTVGLSYNNNFWAASRSINGGNPIAFAYDNDGLLTKAGQLALTRNPQNGLITGTTVGGASDSRTYNSFGELTGYTASYGNGQLYHIFYSRDADGRISNKTEIRGFHITTYAYSYDPAGRLIAVSKNGSPLSSYTYDSNSNRMQATTSSGTVSATYDAQDRMLTYGNASYSYTANGELASQTSGGQTTTYQYDVLGNLTSVTLPSGKAISYVVDAENRRVGKMVNGTLVEGFLYDGDRIVAQVNGNTLVGFPLLGHFHAEKLRRQESNTNASNGLVSQFIYASHATSPDYMISGGVTYRIFCDHLGSPLLVVNTSTGAIAEQITYDEFGNVLSDTNPGFQPFGFAGGLYDQDTKLVRFGARDYDPSTARWTAKDPIWFAGGDINLYDYVHSDPVNFADPAGMDDVDGGTLVDDSPPQDGWYRKAVKWINRNCKKPSPDEVVEKVVPHEIPTPIPGVHVSTDRPEVSVGGKVGVSVDGQEVVTATGRGAVGVTTDGGATDPIFYLDGQVTVKIGKVKVIDEHAHTEFGKVENYTGMDSQLKAANACDPECH